MKCLEFKRLALSNPNGDDLSFAEHNANCAGCRVYLVGVRQMDVDLANSLDSSMPDELIARLQLNQELLEDSTSATPIQVKTRQRFAIAASLVVALIVGGLMLSNQLRLQNKIGEDFEKLLAGVVEHMNEQPITPVWESQRANRTVNTLLASYDGGLKLKNMHNLQFGRICPMGEYRGLHAGLETDSGQITFAYIKGEPVGNLLNASYKGYVTRVKPVRGGNLVIISYNQKSLEQADNELAAAMFWDI